MTVTAGDLYASARARIGLNFADGRLDDTNIVGVNTLMNSGLMDFASVHDWDWLYQENVMGIVSGLETYPVPTGFLRTMWIANDTNGELTLKPRRDAIKYAGQTGTPYFYSIFNDTIYLAPIPSQDATYRIGYYVQYDPIDVATVAELDDITLEIPNMFQGLASLYIAKNIAMSFKDFDAYKLVTEEIRAELKRVSDNTRRSLGPMAPQTRSDWS